MAELPDQKRPLVPAKEDADADTSALTRERSQNEVMVHQGGRRSSPTRCCSCSGKESPQLVLLDGLNLRVEP